MAVFSTADNSAGFTKPPKKDLDLDELVKTPTNKNTKQYTFTNNWFEKQRPVVDKILTTVLDSTKPIRILEIGCYEGRSTVHYIDNHLNHPDSTIVSIDPFSTDDATSPVTTTTKDIFESNINVSKFSKKSKIIVGYSQDVLAQFICDKRKFDYIVVDGSHLSKDSLLDACMSFQLLAPNGVMFFDDYLGGNDDRDTNINYPKIGIDSFLKSYKDHYKVIHSGYHFAIQKTEPINLNKRRIIDCFLFNNEIDMLKLRLEELKDVVDIFVLVESKYTFSGKDKPLYFELIKNEFLKYNIQHIILSESPSEDAWSNEATQRNAPLEYLKNNMLPDDVALLCDLDEIPNPISVQAIRDDTVSAPVYFQMDFYYYNFNWIKKSPWVRASAVTLDTLLNHDIETIRNLQAGIVNAVNPGGWHLSYFMSPELISEKIKAFSHQEWNKEQYLNLDSITAAINSGKDLFSRGEHEDLVPWFGQMLPKNKDIFKGYYMKTILEQFELRVNQPSDINEHMTALKDYASECQHITEMGVRSVVSTWAFLAANPKKLVSIDIVQCPIHMAAAAASDAGIDFQFIIADTSDPNLEIEPTDLLFIDTWHVYDQLKQEFKLHANKAKKYIILHDTTTFGQMGEPNASKLKIDITTGASIPFKGLWPAVEEFLAENKNWVLNKRYTHNNGLTILERIKND